MLGWMMQEERLLMFPKPLKSWRNMLRILYQLFCTWHFKLVVSVIRSTASASFCCSSCYLTMPVITIIFLTYQLKWLPNMACWWKEGGRSEIWLDSLERLCDAVFDMASVANIHLQKACELAGTMPAEARQVLLQVVPAQVLLDSLSQVLFKVFDPRLSRGVLGILHLWCQLKLKWFSWWGKYWGVVLGFYPFQQKILSGEGNDFADIAAPIIFFRVVT